MNSSDNTRHHSFSPSKLQQFELCPLSWRLTKDLPDEQTEAAAEGTMLHAAVAGVLDEAAREAMTDEQAELVSQCINVLRGEADELKGGVLYERKASLHSGDGTLLTEGTADAVVLSDNGREATVIDWKFGFGKVIEAANNLQLAAYCAAVAQEFGLAKVKGIIYQPRLHSLTDISYDNGNGLFVGAVAKAVERIVARCKAPDAYACPGEEQCRYCRARMNCPALKDALVKVADEPAAADPKESLPALPDRDLSCLYERSLVVSDFCKALQDEIKKRCQANGGECGDFMLKETSGGYDLPTADKVFELVNGVLTAQEFCGICKTTMTALSDLFGRKAQAMGVAPTIKAGKEMLKDLLKEELEQKPPRISVVKKPDAHLHV